MFQIRYLAILGIAAIGVGCAHTPVQRGALGGGFVGAGIGAIVGGEADDGALIGAGIGALSGALIGDAVAHDRAHRYESYPPPPPPPPPARPPRTVYRETPPPPAPSHFSQSYRVEDGHYETRLVRSASGEYYEQRVWVPNR